jgi:hypothetical protein
MRRTVLLGLLACLFLCGAARGQGNPAAALDQALRDVCGDVELWPGYDPMSVPLAVFDGSSTFLFRHPAPPEEFTRDGDLWALEGRYPSVTANSSTLIGGVSTATVMLETLPPDGLPEERAALVAHEGFHVFQGTAGRSWGANEADLFTYPVDDARLLMLRRLETEALRRAFASEDEEETRAWALRALSLRDERFALLDPVSQAYERGMETMEGTANYIQSVVEGRDRPSLPEGGFAPENVRSRAYETGTAWAFLLDRFSPEWQEAFGTDDTQFLHSILAGALGDTARSDGLGTFTISEIAAVEQETQSDVEGVLERRVERRAEFESVPGWRVVVEAGEANPLWPQGFDPLNVRLVEGGVLHSRFIKLGNGNGKLEVMGAGALTEEVGPHPLFNGVRRLLVTGFEGEPAVVVESERVTISSDGFSADFVSASVERGDQEVVIHLTPPEGLDEGSRAGESSSP